MKPSLGRIVIFTSGGNHFAAVITKVWSDSCVNLYVFPTGTDVDGFLNNVVTSVVYNEVTSTEYSWHWPPRI